VIITSAGTLFCQKFLNDGTEKWTESQGRSRGQKSEGDGQTVENGEADAEGERLTSDL